MASSDGALLASKSFPTCIHQAEGTSQTPRSLVLSKRKAEDEDQQGERNSPRTPEEDIDDRGPGAFVDEAAYDECHEYFSDIEDDDPTWGSPEPQLEDLLGFGPGAYDAYDEYLREREEEDHPGWFSGLAPDAAPYSGRVPPNALETVLDNASRRVAERSHLRDEVQRYMDMCDEIGNHGAFVDEAAYYDAASEFSLVEGGQLDYYDLRADDNIQFKSRAEVCKAELVNEMFRGPCTRCRAVRWSALARMRSKEHSIYGLRESPFELVDSACKLCQFLGRIGLRRARLTDSYDGKLMFHLRISLTREGTRRCVVIFLEGLSEGCPVTLHSAADNGAWIPQIIDPSFVNYAALRRLLSHCQVDHVDTCHPKSGVDLPGFKVIDCTSRTIVPAPAECKYVALSYVWGLSLPLEAQERSTACYPATIEDSLKVTMELGFRYLWVDRYCIDQDNKIEKHALIQNMDQIYSKAQLTIIAAAGSDPTYGLPGVGSKPRSVQHHVRVGDMKLVQLMYPGSDFPRSAWWERAWTYQEGVLSPRKLVFTDHQVFYVCNQTHFAESLNAYTAGAAGVKTDSFPGSSSFSDMVLPTDSRSYESYLRDITARALSHESDALNACLGILKATNTSHVWGIPIRTYPIPTIALCWRHNTPAHRRLDFPSWSWTGWKGAVDFRDSIVTSRLCQIRLGNDDQNWQRVDEYVWSGRAQEDAGRNNAPRLLQMTGSVLDCTLLDQQWPDLDDFGTAGPQDDRPKPYFLLELNGLSALATLYLDEEMESVQQLRGVIAMAMRAGSEGSCITALLLKPKGEFYTRVGMLELSCGDQYCNELPGLHPFWERRAEARTVIVE